MYKLDLHTHSTASSDGGITANQYKKLLNGGVLDYVAVTDHNRTDFALELNEELGKQIIVGEEIMTNEGEIVGLFLKENIKPGLSAEDTAKYIKEQNGLVYIPHPLETVRKGLPKTALEDLQPLIDIVEIGNGRAVFKNYGPQAAAWAKLNHKIIAASSDAHGYKGVGRTYTSVNAPIDRDNLLEELAHGYINFSWPPLHTLLYPKLNRLRGAFRRSS